MNLDVSKTDTDGTTLGDHPIIIPSSRRNGDGGISVLGHRVVARYVNIDVVHRSCSQRKITCLSYTC